MANIAPFSLVNLAIFIAILLVIGAFILNASRSKRDHQRFGEPPLPPLRAAVINLIPGLGLWKLGLPIQAIAWNAASAVVGILIALLWPKWPVDNRIELILIILLGSALRAERVATDLWKSKKNDCPPTSA